MSDQSLIDSRLSFFLSSSLSLFSVVFLPSHCLRLRHLTLLDARVLT